MQMRQPGGLPLLVPQVPPGACRVGWCSLSFDMGAPALHDLHVLHNSVAGVRSIELILRPPPVGLRCNLHNLQEQVAGFACQWHSVHPEVEE
jgi:hypothetical protein